VAIDIEDDGTVLISGTEDEGMKKAQDWITALTKEIKVGEVYEGHVTRLMNFGAFVEILPGKEGLVHISKLSEERVDRVEDVVQVGDTITVRVDEIDSENRVNLTMDVAGTWEKKENGDRGGRGGFGGNGNGNGGGRRFDRDRGGRGERRNF
jgi:polyribonucleotide nucleotidyltransferase